VDSPEAEVTIDEGLVRSLVAAQHPDLAERELVAVASGWDNTLWRLGHDLLVRLPRRAVAAPLTINEQRWLPEVAAHLPLPVPVPLRVGQPSEAYPWSWSIVPWLSGVPGNLTAITRPADAADRLGRFLRALHGAAPPEAPHNPFRGVPLGQRVGAFEDRLTELSSEIDAPATRRVWDLACGADRWAGPPLWLHGDLHPANTLIEHGTLSGVVDFGDMCAGDPATDIAAFWMLLPTSSWPAFLDAYGELAPDTERRSLGWAVLLALMLIGIGLADRPSYAVVGRSALRRAIEHGLTPPPAR